MTAVSLVTGGTITLRDPVIDTWALTVYNPLDMLKLNPSFVVGEGLFYILAAVTFIHAYSNRNSETGSPLTQWLGCFLGGSVVEFFTTLHPQIDNAFHSQACIMLIDRMVAVYPLVGLYGGLQYISLQLAFSHSTSKSESVGTKVALGLTSGLIGHVLCELLDSTGTYFLWWTWHEGDPAYLSRRAGVPLSSGFWLYAQIASLGLIYAFTRYRSCIYFILGSVFIMPVLFLLPFITVFHPLDAMYGRGELASPLLVAVSAISFFIFVGKLNKVSMKSTLALAWFYILLMAVMWVVFHTTAATNRRYSYGQAYANRDCRGEMEMIGWGTIERERYLCPVKIDQDVYFNMDCLHTHPKDDTEWYWTCGIDITTEALNEMIFRFSKAVALLIFLGVGSRSKEKSE
ncbi:hypothetical protein FOL47_000868 [Perkinsus chesapeaki]|uniref:DUF7802 domain-containing protein n=1 Tax=Perkinsus chesapeaki TaxID=330153 RepID=A0A7J6MLS0_PERCH|nr:hypothetical protein FOL47_000868 [Perkinsus chesapeaki]